MSIVKEFREFAMKGNVIDLAVWVIIWAAFGKIVTSIVEDMIMPIIAKTLWNIDFSNMYYAFNNPAITAWMSLADAKKVWPVIAYWNFLTILVNFLIVAFCIFLVVKALNHAKTRVVKTKKWDVVVEEVALTKDQQLLQDIRDALISKNSR